MCGYVRVCVRDEQRHQALEPPRPPPTTKKHHISLCGPYIMRKPRRGRGVRLYLLSPLYPLSYVSRMCLCCLSLTVNDCVCDMYTKRPKRKSRAHINSGGTCVRRHATDASETDSGGLAIHSRVQSLGDSVGRSRRFVRLPWLGLHCTSWRRRRSMPSSLDE